VTLALAGVLAASLVPDLFASFRPFEPPAGGHSWTNSYLLALVNQHGSAKRVETMADEHSDRERYQELFETLGLDVVAFLDRRSFQSDTQTILLADDDILLVVFPGSAAGSAGVLIRDWILTDLRIRQVSMGDVLVHLGFRDALDLVYEELVAEIREHLKGGRVLWLTGHSLGGALANLTAYRLHDDGVAVQGVYTYAAPKVGDPDWAREFQRRFGERSQQWVVALDPIPRLPPDRPERTYEFVRPLNVIDSGRAQLDGKLEVGALFNILDHRMDAYVRGLHTAMPADLRRAVPEPPPGCHSGQRLVGLHDETGLPLCKTRGSTRIHPDRCRSKGGAIEGKWCVFHQPEKRRHRVRGLEEP
jgi:hypothetical protein